MKSDNIGLPNTSSFIPHLGSVSSYFPCTFFLDVLPSSQNQYIAKQTSFSLPHASLPVLISRSAAGCPVLSSDPSWQGSFHNVYFFFLLLLKLPFLIVLTYVLSDFLKTKLYSNSFLSPHHTCVEQFYLPLVFLSWPSHCLSVLPPSSFLDFSIFFHFGLD